jgi:hypothetical protein
MVLNWDVEKGGERVDSNRKMLLFDCLPLEVIREHIMPCLDWYGRLHLNMVLKPHERIATQIQPVKLIQMTMQVNLTNIKKTILKVEKTGIISEMNYRSRHTEADRRWALLEMFETLEQNLTLTQHNMNFRNEVLNKIDEFIVEEPVYLSQMPQPFLNRFYKISATLRTTMTEKYPFLYHLYTPIEGWSAV